MKINTGVLFLLLGFNSFTYSYPSINTLTTSLPEKEDDSSCFVLAMVTERQRECNKLGGYFHDEAFLMKETQKCKTFATCLLPATDEDIEKKSQCVEVDDGFSKGKIYCSVLFDDVTSQGENESFLEYAQRIDSFYEVLDLKPVNTSEIESPETGIPSLPEKEDSSSCGISAMVTERQKECNKLGGYFHDEAFLMKETQKCKTFATCFLPATAEDIEKKSQCVEVDDGYSKEKIYCSVLFDDVTSQGENESFLEYAQRIDSFYEVLHLKPVNTSEIESPETEIPSLPEKEDRSSCGISAMVTERQKECNKLGGYFHDEAFLMKETQKCKTFATCLLPATAEDIEKKSQCVEVDDGFSKGKIYCSVLFDDVTSQGENESFLEYAQRIDSFYEVLDLKPVNASEIESPETGIPSLPEKEDRSSCGISAMVTERQKECNKLGGYFHDEAFLMKETQKCETFATCLLPATAEDIEKKSQCVEVDDGYSKGKIYCSVLFDDVTSQGENESFLEYAQRIDSFYEVLDLKPVNASEIESPETGIPSLPEKEDRSSCGISAMVTERQKECNKLGGYFHDEAFLMKETQKCKTFATCFLPATDEDIEKKSQCVEVDDGYSKGKIYCSVLFDDVTSQGENESFLEYAQRIDSFYEVLDLKPVNASEIESPETGIPSLPEKEDRSSCGISAMVTERQKECNKLGGYFHDEAFLMKETQKCKTFATCLLPATAEDIEKKSQCVEVDDGYSKGKIYCSVLFDDVTSQGENESFLEYAQRIDSFYEVLDLKPVNASEIESPETGIPSLPEKEDRSSCGISAMVTERQKECNKLGGYFHDEAFLMKETQKCKTFATCFLPATDEDIEKKSQCVEVDDGYSKGKIYCSVLFDDVTSQGENESFLEYAQRIDSFYEVLDLKPVNASEIESPETGIPSLPEKEDRSSCGISAMVTERQKECNKLGGYFHDEAFLMKETQKCKTFATCFLPATDEDIEKKSQCVEVDDGFSKGKIYCSVLFDDVTSQGENESFLEYAQRIDSFYEVLDLKPVNTSEIESPETGIPSLPEKEDRSSCGISAMVTERQKECNKLGGYFHDEAFLMKETQKCKTFATCLLPATAEDIEKKSQCVEVDDGFSKGKIYCSVLFDDVTSQGENESFLEYAQRIDSFYEVLDLKPVNASKLESPETKTTKTIPSSTKSLPTINNVTDEPLVKPEETNTPNLPEKEDNSVVDDRQCAGKWAQCGGKMFNGPTCCKSGFTCHKFNEYFSQCINF
ncbi:hypothetical protein H8356DRAFT_1052784 [Neocallimastix lanati (nom. inval.)]|nr:hypothetical protein H8356DRAFT_1052784 [Neocallimastix sp. JGI-2020a]